MIGLIFLALPFLAMLCMIATNMRHLSHTEYRLAIEGYDPRDLLKGHYLVFRYKWPAEAVDMFDDHTYPRTQQVCACMTGEAVKPQVRFDACESTHPRQASCAGALKVAGDSGAGGYQPEAALRRYFIPEAEAPLLERLLREGRHSFAVGIVPRGDGAAQLKQLYIDDVPWDEFLKTLPEAP